MKPHPGIRIDRIAVSGFIGLIFVIGVLVIGYIGLPPYRDLFVLTVAGGLLGAAALRIWYRYF